MPLPLVNVFSNEYRKYSTRIATNEESLAFYKKNGYFLHEIPDKVLECIWFAQEAAEYMCRVGVDNELESFIDDALHKSISFEKMIGSMPLTTPKVLLDYQASPKLTTSFSVDNAINYYGDFLSDGQYLFHGGNWDDFNNGLITERPLSTSFCPQVALRNAEWCGKAYKVGKVDLLVLKVKNPKTKVFVYNKEGEHSNEKEILFSSGAKLMVKKIEVVNNDYFLGSEVSPGKYVPCTLIEADIS